MSWYRVRKTVYEQLLAKRNVTDLDGLVDFFRFNLAFTVGEQRVSLRRDLPVNFFRLTVGASVLLLILPYMARRTGKSEMVSSLLWWTTALGLFSLLLAAELAALRYSPQLWLRTPGGLATSLFRNIPSFVSMFYLAFVLPGEFDLGGEVVKIPAWLEATLALTVPVAGFASDQVLRLFKDREAGAGHARLTFGVAWTQYFLVIIMASSTASVIGVDEIVARANTVVAAIREPEFMLWIYLYVALWFLGLGTLVVQLSHQVIKRFGH